jgi:hypothetical protein
MIDKLIKLYLRCIEHHMKVKRLGKVEEVLYHTSSSCRRY